MSDIVIRLRVMSHHAKKLAENESLHELHREAFTRCEYFAWEAADEIDRLREQLRLANIDNFNTTAEAERLQEAADEIERLRAERDEARRMACEKEETLGCDERGVPRNGYARDHAKQRGWDCFNEDTND